MNSAAKPSRPQRAAVIPCSEVGFDTDAARRILPLVIRLDRRLSILERMPAVLRDASAEPPDAEWRTTHRTGRAASFLHKVGMVVEGPEARLIEDLPGDAPFRLRMPGQGTPSVTHRQRILAARRNVGIALDTLRSMLDGHHAITADDARAVARHLARTMRDDRHHEAGDTTIATLSGLSSLAVIRSTGTPPPHDVLASITALGQGRRGPLDHWLVRTQVKLVMVAETRDRLALSDIWAAHVPDRDDPMTALRDAAAEARLRTVAHALGCDPA